MAVALLDGRGDFHFGFLLQLADLALLVLGELSNAVGLDEFHQGQAANDLFAHLVDARFVSHDEDEVVAQAAQADAVTALALEYSGGDLRDGVHGGADGGAVIRHNGQPRAAVAKIVVHFTRSGGEWDHFEDGAGGAAEDGFDAVVELGAGLAGIDVGFLAADDLGEICLGEKTERHAGAVVEVGGFALEAFPGGVNEAEVQRRADGREAEALGRDALQLVVEDQAVNENRAGRVGGMGREAGVVLFVELDGEGFLGAAGDVMVHGRDELGAAKASEYLLPYRLKAGINMVEVNCGRPDWTGLPELGDGAGQEAQHPAHTVEII